MTSRSFGRFLIAAVLLLAPGAFAAEFGSLTVAQVSARLKEKNFFVFDNNNNERFQKGHVPGAKWLNPYAVRPSDLPADKSATLVFYCASEH
jgi:rhodanese-related sulfurtransferase